MNAFRTSRFLHFILLVAMVSTFLTGCGKNPQESEENHDMWNNILSICAIVLPIVALIPGPGTIIAVAAGVVIAGAALANDLSYRDDMKKFQKMQQTQKSNPSTANSGNANSLSLDEESIDLPEQEIVVPEINYSKYQMPIEDLKIIEDYLKNPEKFAFPTEPKESSKNTTVGTSGKTGATTSVKTGEGAKPAGKISPTTLPNSSSPTGKKSGNKDPFGKKK